MSSDAQLLRETKDDEEEQILNLNKYKALWGFSNFFFF